MTVAAARDQETVPDLTVENGNWNAASLRSVREVLNSARKELLDAFGRPPDASIRVAWWSQDPRVFFDRRPYEIRVNARDTHWCQYVYQFSHELCHVMTHFDRYKEHRHKWFEESLCEMASLFVLHRLAQGWAGHPPDILGASGFAPHHATYAERIEEKHRLPPGRDLARWLDANIEAMEANSLRRELNAVVAVALLDRFRDEPSLWGDCGWLNHWDARMDRTFSEYLDSWAACLHNDGRGDRAPTVVRKLFLPDAPGQIGSR